MVDVSFWGPEQAFDYYYAVLLKLVDFIAVYKKHHPPSLSDEVWRLEKIGKDGAFHKRLSIERVRTVKDFLILLHLDPARLRNVRFLDLYILDIFPPC